LAFVGIQAAVSPRGRLTAVKCCIAYNAVWQVTVPRNAKRADWKFHKDDCKFDANRLAALWSREEKKKQK
jgi:hypothetical protein